MSGLQLLEAFFLEDDKAICQVERGLRVAVGADVAVEVGAGEREHERSPGMRLLPGGDRGVAAARVQRDERVGARAAPLGVDADAMAEGAQVRGPAQRGVAVAVPRARRGGRYNADLQASR